EAEGAPRVAARGDAALVVRVREVDEEEEEQGDDAGGGGRAGGRPGAGDDRRDGREAREDRQQELGEVMAVEAVLDAQRLVARGGQAEGRRELRGTEHDRR